MKNWIWMHPKPGENPEIWKRRLAQCRAAGLDAILACIHPGNQALYASQHLPVAAPLLESLLPLATAEGIELHAWIVTLRCGTASVQHAHPEWFCVNRNGASSLDAPPYIDSYQFLCPSQAAVQAFVTHTVTELAAYSELKGIHLDYIRYPDVILPEALQPKYNLIQDREFPRFDFCYCQSCREAFRHKEGVDPLELEDPASHDAWRHFRYERIREVVVAAARPARAAGKCFSAAVFATPELARAYVRQDWPRWDLDAVFPMIYHDYYARPIEWIEQATREGVDGLAGRCPLYSGLFIPALGPEEVPRAVEHALKAGSAGISIFSFGAMTEAHWPALTQALSP